MSDLSQAQRQRDIARSHRDEALSHFDDAMKIVEKTQKDFIEATREKNTAIKDRHLALSYSIVTQRKAAKKAQERIMKLRKQKLVSQLGCDCCNVNTFSFQVFERGFPLTVNYS